MPIQPAEWLWDSGDAAQGPPPPPPPPPVPQEYPGPDAPALPTSYLVDEKALLYRVSEIYQPPDFVDGRIVGDWEPNSLIRLKWGTFRVLIDGQDVTAFRGGMVQDLSFSQAEPFGDGPASMSFSALVPRDNLGSPPTSWPTVGNPVDILRVHPNGTTTTNLWAGEIVSYDVSVDADTWTWSVQCQGSLWAADLQVHKPPLLLDPTDIGTVIASDLNRVVSRRYANVSASATSIQTTQRGSSDQSVLQRVQELLANATLDDGTNQITVKRAGRRSYEIALKDRINQHWMVHHAQPGVATSLTLDATQAPNVIYGQGVATTGYGWGNWVYPASDTSPYRPYPLPVSPLQVIGIGTADADTTSGEGVSDLQRRIRDLGINGATVTVDGVYNTSDARAVRVVQEYFGIQVDGVVGPQTWAACFPQYPANALAGAFRLPLAYDPKVMPRLFRADGSDAGPNPVYDHTVLRVETDINYGSGVSKADARRSAKAQLARDYPAGWTGTITLTMDPDNGSMFDIQAGQNIRLAGWGDADGVLLHISQVQYDPMNESVALTVDQKARDLSTLVQIQQRNREVVTNPMRLPWGGVPRKSQVVSDTVVPYDGESAGGVIKKTALIGGLWVYVDVPVSTMGQVAKLELVTDPPVQFSVAFFGNTNVTPSDLIAHVGDPLAARTDGFGPYDRLEEDFPWMGWLESFGGPGQAAGYGSGYQDSPYTPGTATPLTGKLFSSAGWQYLSSNPPFLRVFFWSPSSSSISGRIYPAPLEV